VEIALYTLGGLALATGLAGLVLPLLPGAPLMLVGVLLVAWAGHFTAVGWGTVAGAVVLTGMMIAVEWAAGALGARAFGASRWAMLGAAVGAVVGLFFGLPGILLGPVVGGIAFEYWKDPDFERAFKAGAGVFVGFVVGSAVKVALGFALVGLVLLALVV
jgi:uncharacterized protein YqgC (DUF456 family)